jgi:hypothetical protein
MVLLAQLMKSRLGKEEPLKNMLVTGGVQVTHAHIALYKIRSIEGERQRGWDKWHRLVLEFITSSAAIVQSQTQV